MSVATRRAIYGKLSGDTTLTSLLATPPTGVTKSIYYQVAAQGAEFPYVIFQKQAGTPSYALAANTFDNEVWMVKGVTKNPGPVYPSDPVETISSRLDALLTDGIISISGKVELYLRRESDLDYSEERSGVIYRHSGALFRLVYTT